MIDIFYIEDDCHIAQIVKEYLEQRNYTIIIHSTAAAVKEALQQHVPQLILLDWNMPDGDGVNLCRWIRSGWKEVPIIFLTVRNDTQDVIQGFQNGADDYVTKPFNLEVLHSRIRALLRRSGNLSNQHLSCGPITIDQDRMAIFYKEKEISVSQTEYQILQLLMSNKGKTITRQSLLEQIWDSNGNYVNDNTLTVTMKRIREKLNQPYCLKTVRSFGYRMEDAE